VRLTILPMTFRQACAWVEAHHRHNKPPRGHKFSVCVVDDEGVIHGVAMIGRPVARAWDDGLTAEVNRTVTDGTKNANSALYGAAWRICREMGYQRVVTYTQGDEPGTSLRAAGYRIVGERSARPGWADSTADERLRKMRDPVGNGGVPRTVWERAAW
jgi:hypothetical protein